MTTVTGTSVGLTDPSRASRESAIFIGIGPNNREQ
jgi:hypothetical protein